MKKGFLLCLCAMAVMAVNAQVDEKTAADEALKTKVKSAQIDSAKNWKFTGVTGLNAAQTALFNWAAGGNNNVTGFVFANMTLSYKKDKWTWDTNLDTELGEMQGWLSDASSVVSLPVGQLPLTVCARSGLQSC